jgi:hypothetical protein
MPGDIERCATQYCAIGKLIEKHFPKHKHRVMCSLWCVVEIHVVLMPVITALTV